MKLSRVEKGDLDPAQVAEQRRTGKVDGRGRWRRRGKTDEGERRRGRMELALAHVTQAELARRVGRSYQAVSACRRNKTWVSDEWMDVIERVIEEQA